MPLEASRREFMKMTAMTAAGTWAMSEAAEANSSFGTIGGLGGSEAGEQAAAGGGQVPLAPPDKQSPDAKMPQPVKRKIGWAIVGLGKLAIEEVLPAFAESKFSEPVALVSGHPDKARQLAEVFGINPKNIYNYENYDRIAEDSRIEAVYNILPNSMHAEYTIRALKAGKHVLCEKPMAATIKECEQMIVASKAANRKLMIAYRLHYEPHNLKAMELCHNGTIGELKTFTAANSQNTEAPNIRLSKALAGGPVGDVGVYCINAARYVSGEEPIEVIAFAHQPADEPRFREVPETVSFTLRYPSGLLAQCECGFGHARSERFRALGSKGFVEMDPAFGYQGQRLFLKTGSADKGDDQKAEIRLKAVNQFAEEMDHFSECILNNTELRTPGEMGLADMRIVLAVLESARTGRPVRIAR